MFVTAITAAVLAATTPVAASDIPAPVASPTAKAVTISPNQRVCLVDKITGSMLPRRTCKTLAQWRALSIDPLPGR